MTAPPRLALAVALLLGLSSCKTILGAVTGAGAGSLLGPVGAIGGAAVGAAGGHTLDENKRLEDENEDLREKIENLDGLKREVTDLRARLDKTRSAPPASGPLDLSYGPQLPWYEDRIGWFTWKTWGLVALVCFALFRFRAGVKYLLGLVPWLSLLSLIFGKKQSGTSPPMEPRPDPTAPPTIGE